MKKDLVKEITDNLNISIASLERGIQEDVYQKISYKEFERLINILFSTPRSDLIKFLNSYFSKILISPSIQFFHLIVEYIPVKASCNEMIQNYKYVFMFNPYLDCSQLLYRWSPTESYFPLLSYIQKSNPDIPIDYTYWLRKFKDLPTAFKFLKQNSVKIEFTEKEDLSELYKTIPQQYVKDFLNLLGNKGWYMDTIKDTDHFIEEIEKW